jgi:hypothetical protein
VVDNAAGNQCGGVVTVTVAALTVTVTEMGQALPVTHAAVEVPSAVPAADHTDSAKGPAPVLIVSSDAPANEAPTTVQDIKVPTTLPTLLPSSTGLYTNGTEHDNHSHGHKHPHHKPTGGFRHPHHRPSGSYAQPTAVNHHGNSAGSSYPKA